MKNTNTKATTVANNKAAFLALLENFNQLANSNSNSAEYIAALDELAFATACAVLKKVITASANKTLEKIRAEMIKARYNLKGIQWASDNEPEYTVSKTGKVDVMYNRDKTDTENKLIKENLGVGYDLIQAAYLEILEQVKRQRDSGETIDLLREYTFRKLDKRVIIRDNDSAAFRDVTTTPIQQVFKAVRREIENTRSARCIDSGYSYIEKSVIDSESSVIDSESGAVATVYERQEKYADIGGYVCDFNGKEIVYTASAATVEELDKAKANLIEKTDFNEKQKIILSLRLRGYGDKAIGTYLGKQPRLIRRYRGQMQQACYDIGFKPVGMKERPIIK